MYYQIVATIKEEKGEVLYADFLVESDSALEAIIKFNKEPKDKETKVLSVSPTNISKVI